MIVFLTLLYCALLFLLVKVGVVRLNTFWKLSPLLWMVLLFIVLFVPMQWGAPSGPVMIYNRVVEVVPNVSGEVVGVEVSQFEQVESGQTLFQIDRRPFVYEFDRLVAAQRDARAQLGLAKAQYERFSDAAATSAVSRAQFEEWKWRAEAASATIEGLDARIARARFDLEETTVTTPIPGIVIGGSILPGQRVSNMPTRSWMGIQDPTLHLYVSLPQTRMRHVRLGQPVEVTLLLFPGRILAGRVRSFGAMTPQGQLQPSGVVSAAVLPTDRPLPFAVGIELDEKVDLDEELWTDLPGGSMGEATVYTESVEATHIIRRVMIRMEAWLNYLRPM